MLSILFNGWRVPLPSLQQTFARVASALELSFSRAELQPKFRAALKELEGSVAAIVDRQVSFANPGVRDFLQAVVIEDNLMPAILETIETYEEVRQCWMLWSAEEVRTTRSPVSEELWLSALDRMRNIETGYALDRLTLTIDVYDHFRSDASLDRVRKAISVLEEAELVCEEAGRACLALEYLHINILPEKEVDRANQVITIKTAEMLEEFAFALGIEDIVALDDALHKYGSDNGLVSKAVNAALECFTKNLDDQLSEIDYVDDLDSFEEELNRLMDRRSYKSKTVRRDIEYRRERLYEREQKESAKEGYSAGTTHITRSQISTDEIRSMFAGLESRSYKTHSIRS